MVRMFIRILNCIMYRSRISKNISYEKQYETRDFIGTLPLTHTINYCNTEAFLNYKPNLKKTS
jgi:hypothetical protein